MARPRISARRSLPVAGKVRRWRTWRFSKERGESANNACQRSRTRGGRAGREPEPPYRRRPRAQCTHRGSHHRGLSQGCATPAGPTRQVYTTRFWGPCVILASPTRSSIPSRSSSQDDGDEHSSEFPHEGHCPGMRELGQCPNGGSADHSTESLRARVTHPRTHGQVPGGLRRTVALSVWQATVLLLPVAIVVSAVADLIRDGSSSPRPAGRCDAELADPRSTRATSGSTGYGVIVKDAATPPTSGAAPPALRTQTAIW